MVRVGELNKRTTALRHIKKAAKRAAILHAHKKSTVRRLGIYKSRRFSIVSIESDGEQLQKGNGGEGDSRYARD